MNALKIMVLLGLLSVAQGLLAAGSADENTAIEAGRAERMILVTFVDKTINRVPAAGFANTYRARGVYQKSTWSSRIAEQISSKYRLKQINDWPITALGVYCVVYEVTGNATVESALEALRHDERVAVAQPMHMFRTMGVQSRYNDPYFQLQKNFLSLHIEPAQRRATGRNVKIAIIDTGVDDRHPDLSDKLSFNKDFTGKDSGIADLHGTAVAGMIGAAANNGIGIVGIAPGAELLGFKACWQSQPSAMESVCNSLTLAIALDTAIRMQPHILNLSLTGPPDPLLQQLIEQALANGIIVVAAAVEHPDAQSGFPASLEHVIAAYAEAQTVSAKALSLKAPGDNILTTFPHNTYNFISGSSIAAAQISGVIALLLEMRPELNSAEIAALLAKSSPASQQNGDQATVVNVDAVMRRLANTKFAASEKKMFFN